MVAQPQKPLLMIALPQSQSQTRVITPDQTSNPGAIRILVFGAYPFIHHSQQQKNSQSHNFAASVSDVNCAIQAASPSMVVDPLTLLLPEYHNFVYIFS